MPRIFRQFCKRTRRLSWWKVAPPQKSTRHRQHFTHHNSFSLTASKSTPKPNNHGRLQRRRRPASSSGCLRGTYLASSISVCDLASRQTTSLTDMSNLPSCHKEESRAPLWRTISHPAFPLGNCPGIPPIAGFHANEYPPNRGQAEEGCCLCDKWFVVSFCRLSIAHLQFVFFYPRTICYRPPPTHRRPIT